MALVITASNSNPRLHIGVTVSVQLSSIQKILQQLGIEAYLRSRSPERPLATLGVEIQTGSQESNLLEVCEIPVPDSDVFLLQWFVQLPLSEPFSPADPIPEFQIPEVMAFCAEINQVLPVGIFNVYQKQLCFRHIFSCEFVSVSQVEYLLQTIEGTIQRLQPILQSVAIGSQNAHEAIDSIDTVFGESDNEDTQNDEQVTSDSISITPVVDSDAASTQDDPSTPIVPKRLSIDDIANMTINIEDEQSIDEWSSDFGEHGDKQSTEAWDLSEDFVVFDDENSE